MRCAYPGGQTTIFSNVQSNGKGKAGNIRIRTGILELLQGAQLISDTRGIGDAGDIEIEANRISIRDISRVGEFPSSVRSLVEQNAQGNAGDIRITTNIFESSNNNDPLPAVAVISATRGIGNGGNIFLEARDRISLSNSIIDTSVGENANGKGGNIFLTTKNLELFNGGRLSAETFGNGRAGNIEVKATDTIHISGSNLFDGIPSGIFTFTYIDPKSDGGNITLNTNNFRLTDGAVLDSRTFFGGGNGGDIIVNATKVDILNGGNIITSTFENGKAGNVTVNATKQVTLSGSDPKFSQRLATDDVSFSTFYLPNSGIYGFSTGSGVTGNIEINSPNITLDNKATLNAESASGNGGNINLNSNLLLLRRGAQISTNAGTAQLGGNGGNITINTPFLVAVPGEDSDISANAFTGSGGNVRITAQGIYGIQFRPQPTSLSDITASSEFGASGNVNLVTPDVDPSRGLVSLPVNLVDRSNQIAQNCSPSTIAANSFTITGRGGLPHNPTEPLQDSTTLAQWVRLRSALPLPLGQSPLNTPTTQSNLSAEYELRSHSENSVRTTIDEPIAVSTTPKVAATKTSIVEAQGWIVNSKGEIFLVAQAPTVKPHSLALPTASCQTPVK